MNNRTPGPWQAIKAGRDGWFLIVAGRVNGRIVANVNAVSYRFDALDDYVDMPAEANAEYIVRACNAHEDLLGAARNAVNALAALATGQLQTVTPDSPAIAQLRSAIAKAQGE